MRWSPLNVGCIASRSSSCHAHTLIAGPRECAEALQHLCSCPCHAAAALRLTELRAMHTLSLEGTLCMTGRSLQLLPVCAIRDQKLPEAPPCAHRAQATLLAST